MISHIFMKLFLLVAMQIKFLNCIISAQFIFTSDNLGHLSLQLCYASYAIKSICDASN
jgi:hypothetical protein